MLRNKKDKKDFYPNINLLPAWFCLCNLQVHCSETDKADRRAVHLLLSVIEAYKEGGGGNDWRFCMIAASVLSDIAMNNETKGKDVHR